MSSRSDRPSSAAKTLVALLSCAIFAIGVPLTAGYILSNDVGFYTGFGYKMSMKPIEINDLSKGVVFGTLFGLLFWAFPFYLITRVFGSKISSWSAYILIGMLLSAFCLTVADQLGGVCATQVLFAIIGGAVVGAAMKALFSSDRGA